METTLKLGVRQAFTSNEDVDGALSELQSQLEQPELRAVLVFCSPTYDLAKLGAGLKRHFPCPVVGCTTAGQIGRSGFQAKGISAVSLSGPIVARPRLLSPLSGSAAQAAKLAREVAREQLEGTSKGFGLLLVDGLAMAEEQLAAALYQSLGNLPLLGGSAGDDLRFERTHVYFDGEFLSDAAVFTMFETGAAFEVFKVQHFEPTERRLVITAATPETRTVQEINGLPAAEAYAAAVGVPVSALNARLFSKHPVMLRLGGEHFIRGIQRANPDGSLSFYCAIDEGLVLKVGASRSPQVALSEGFESIVKGRGLPKLVIGCDCILRRLELEQDGLDSWVGDFFIKNHVMGFSTYGEQINAVHVNQTFTGVALWGN